MIGLWEALGVLVDFGQPYAWVLLIGVGFGVLVEADHTQDHAARAEAKRNKGAAGG
ncbi:hypothetical protein NLX83_39710 [Allokutzneria sp. A3M-2-11 16]|uniref:hypothetical protein n=1 Tax=Allokutzneria sp. A3M-2-11 16 TaxID=2962043 RepID=UPI0020B8A5F8|nr:hypothetical protein [Allokutzneria sp. A3M-2-11 16]MCP3805412.1 hypothetical protein [Allokutzneria sp. A3M-2-11 16]